MDDLPDRHRHKHRWLTRSRLANGNTAGLSRAEQVDRQRLVSRNERLGLEEEGGEAMESSLADLPPLGWIADRLEEQASESGQITARLKEVLEKCLQAAGDEATSNDTKVSRTSKSPEDLLSMFAKIIARRQQLQPADCAWAASDNGGQTPDFASGAEELRWASITNLVRRHRQRFVPAVTVTPDQTRLEKFEDGSEIVKDALGRVLAIQSATGESLSMGYDRSGNLDYFCRCDSQGKVHSICRKDAHGVVVRDASGRVRAAGESMTVDPHGCLSVHNQDGQMVSLDLVRGLHIERRRLADLSGHLSTVTGVFAHDGFRMATHFHDVVVTCVPVGKSYEKVSPLRFYGRDGSMVEFACEDDLLAVTPVQVKPPGSLPVDNWWRGKGQGGTAWEAVQEYIELLL